MNDFDVFVVIDFFFIIIIIIVYFDSMIFLDIFSFLTDYFYWDLLYYNYNYNIINLNLFSLYYYFP